MNADFVISNRHRLSLADFIALPDCLPHKYINGTPTALFFFSSCVSIYTSQLEALINYYNNPDIFSEEWKELLPNNFRELFKQAGAIL